jgi:hypothetical protein
VRRSSAAFDATEGARSLSSRPIARTKPRTEGRVFRLVPVRPVVAAPDRVLVLPLHPVVGLLRRRPGQVVRRGAVLDATERARNLAAGPISRRKPRTEGRVLRLVPVRPVVAAPDRLLVLPLRPVVGPPRRRPGQIRRRGAVLEDAFRARALRSRPVVGPHPSHAGVGCRIGARLDELWRARSLRQRPVQLAPHLVPRRADLLRRGRVNEFVVPVPSIEVRIRGAGGFTVDQPGGYRVSGAGGFKLRGTGS